MRISSASDWRRLVSKKLRPRTGRNARLARAKQTRRQLYGAVLARARRVVADSMNAVETVGPHRFKGPNGEEMTIRMIDEDHAEVTVRPLAYADHIVCEIGFADQKR